MKHENTPSNKELETSVDDTVRGVTNRKLTIVALYNLLINDFKQASRCQLINIDNWARGKIQKIFG